MAASLVATRLSAPLRISLLYALIGAGWIWLTDEQLFQFGSMPPEAWLLSVGKGLFFVLASSVLIYVLVSREVRRRKRSAAQLEAVLAAAPLGIAAVDATAAVTHWNRAAERLLGRTAREAVGRRLEALSLAPLDGAAAGAAVDVELPVEGDDVVPVRVFVAELPGPGSGRVLLLQDLRPQLEAETAQRKLQKLDAVARLAGGIAQEFNNILTAVLGHAALLADEQTQDDARLEHADELRRATGRAAALTRQLLVISGQHVAQPAALCLSTLLDEMRPAIDRILGDAVRCELRLEAEAWPVVCDPAQLQQLVVELLVNARDAMPAGGALVLEIRNLSTTGDPDLPAGDYVLLRVADTGAGMDGPTLERLFEPFFTTKRQGTGLGLATVYATVQKYGARIRVRSTPRQGTAFDIFWPRATEPRRAPPAAPAAAAPGHLLLVEDDSAVRDLAARVLRRAGHHVTAADSAEAALQVLAPGTAFDLVIADIVLPGMSGTEFADRLRLRHPDIPVLFTSGNAAGALRDAADLLHGAAFMEKPYAPDELLARVAALLRPAPR